MNAPGIAMVLVCLAALVGCSSNLSRSYAEKHIFLDPATLLLRYGTVGVACDPDYNDSPVVRQMMIQQDHPDTNERLFRALGYITIEAAGPGKRIVRLTPAGEAAIEGEPYGQQTKNGCESAQVTFVVARVRNLQVTGIRQEGTTALVDYSYEWEPTPLGKQLTQATLKRIGFTATDLAGMNSALNFRSNSGAKFTIPIDAEYSGLKRSARVKFSKYDDGWRSGD